MCDLVYVGSGTVDFPEFLNMMARKMESFDSEDEVREAFRVFDYNRTGFIPVEEMKFVLEHINSQMTAQEIADLLTQTDIDGDGLINYDGTFIPQHVDYVIMA